MQIQKIFCKIVIKNKKNQFKTKNGPKNPYKINKNAIYFTLRSINQIYEYSRQLEAIENKNENAYKIRTLFICIQEARIKTTKLSTQLFYYWNLYLPVYTGYPIEIYIERYLS